MIVIHAPVKLNEMRGRGCQIRLVVGCDVTGRHIVKHFDQELRHLDALIGMIGGMAVSQLDAALEALTSGDDGLAMGVIDCDAHVDRLERDVCQLAVRLIALRQPTARDLRQVFSAYKAASEFERIGDYAANLAKRSFILKEKSPPELTRSILQMGRYAQAMTKDIVDAFMTRDAEKALAVWSRDEELDRMHTALFHELLSYMIEDVRNITPCTHLLFIGKNLERVGDHATNIAETLHFLVAGTALTKCRTKRDLASFSREPAITLEAVAERR
jgi:phosphate transport system protein